PACEVDDTQYGSAMEEKPDDAPEDPALISNRPMDILVALLFLAASAIVIYDSIGLAIQWQEVAPGNWVPKFTIDPQRFGWQEGIGPGPGYFPFYIAVIIVVASLVNLFRAVTNREPNGSESFVGRAALPRVLSMLVPSIGYVLLIEYLGIYVASAI